MATPSIRIDGSVSGVGTTGESRDDLILAETWTFVDTANGAGTYAWVLRARPVGSSAALVGAGTPTPTLTPDVVGTYLVEVTFDGSDRSGYDNAIGEFISDQGGAAIKLDNGTRVIGSGETIQFDDEVGWAPVMDAVLRTHDNLAEMDGAAQGSLFYASSTTKPAVLAPGASGQILQTQGAGANPQWADAAVASNTPPVDVDVGPAVAGSSAQVSRQDHKHDVDVGTPLEITDSTNAEGVSKQMNRRDHQHAHGNRGGGTLHADATTSVDGFMTAADKTKLDGYPAAPVGGMIFWGNGNVGAAADTRYLNPGSEDATALATRNWSLRVPRAGTIKNLHVRHNVAAGNGSSVVYTLHKNGVATALTTTLATGAIGDAEDKVNTVTVAQGDKLDLVATKAATIVSGAIYVTASVEFV